MNKKFQLVSEILNNDTMTVSNDLQLYLTTLDLICNNIDYKINILKSENDPITRVITLQPNTQRSGPNILISAGFHGNEKGPCWGLLKFLSTHNNVLENANVTFLPIVNLFGFQNNIRKNKYGEDCNRGFIHNEITGHQLSHEGKVLINNFDFIMNSCLNGFLTLHENHEQGKFFMYVFDKKVDLVTDALRKIGENFFEIMPTGFRPKFNETVHNGIVFIRHRGALEDLLYHKGILNIVCTETSDKVDNDKRINSNMELIKVFVETIVNENK